MFSITTASASAVLASRDPLIGQINSTVYAPGIPCKHLLINSGQKSMYIASKKLSRAPVSRSVAWNFETYMKLRLIQKFVSEKFQEKSDVNFNAPRT